MEKKADEVLDYLQGHGFSVYKVGGYVRDKVLGVPIHDIDMATSATPEQVMALFPQVIPTGIKHGTVTVGWKGCFFEVTTFRQEVGYSNRRHPDEVQFVTCIEDDLSRRDFTMNAMAMNLAGEWVDPFGGREDIKQKILRAVGVPRQRFEEDALRILRGIRFSARFSLIIEEKTWLAMKESGECLRAISKERIRDEISKMVEGENPLTAIVHLATPGLLPFPDWSRVFSHFLGHSCRGRIEETSHSFSRWALFLAMSGMDAEQAYQFLYHWRFPKMFAHEMRLLLRFFQSAITEEWMAKKILLTYDWKIIQAGLMVKRLLKGYEPYLQESVWENWNDAIPIRQPKELAVKGHQFIQELHRKAGPWLGQLLDHLFEQVAVWGLPNEKEALLEEARKVLNDEGTDTKDL